MPRYVIVYLGGEQPSSPQEGQQNYARYQQWLQDLGESVISPANPLKDTRTINPDGSVSTGGSSTMSGYTLVEADSIDAAVDMARGCPFLDINGSLEVSQLIEMPDPG